MTKAIKWANSASSDDLKDAAAFLGLLGVTQVDLVEEPADRVQAKDLLRAGGFPGSPFPGLPQTNAGVAEWLKQIKAGEKIPPCLVLRGSLTYNRPPIIAEGYHRVSACYLLGEKTEVAVCWLAVS